MKELTNTHFDEIRKMTDSIFAVRHKDKWGIYNVETCQYLLNCKYDRIIYEGGLVALLNENGLWGAKTVIPLDNISYSILKVDIPISYKEIKILDSSKLIFGVKYTIVDKDGEVYDGMLKFLNLDKQCEIIDSNYDRILAHKDGKYGFISAKGYVTIPFQFDFVERREDGYFDVKAFDDYYHIPNRRASGAWGIIDISGREIVGIKYTERLPLKFANTVVQNAATGRYGVLSEDGSEPVPSIYEHLMIQDNFIFVGNNGYSESKRGNFFSDVDHATWGVMDLEGKTLIRPNYECFKIQDVFILAGRNGSMLYVDGYGRYYSGVYDLFTLSGELIFGGFSEFAYDSENDIYIFFLGGKWQSYSIPVIENEWNTIYAHDYKFVRGIGLWLFLDKDLKSIKRRTNGSQIKFNKGAICKIEIKQQANKNVYMYNMPIDIMAKGFSRTYDNNIVIADCNKNESQKFAALNVSTGEETPYYQRIEFIDKYRFFFAEEDKVGIRDYRKIIIKPEYLFITHPVNGFYFAAKEIDNRFSNLALRSLDDENLLLNAIEKIETSKLINSVAIGKLKIESCFEGTGLESILFPKLSIFDKSFVEQVSDKESECVSPKLKNIYWFANDYRMKEKDNSDDYGDSDDYNYARDSWDAMTDGMYGDMPDGFDGDYSFMGH